MLKTPLNQRYATYEDLFTEFAAPILFRQAGSWEDVYYLYSPFKGLCPTKSQILSGINMHYATRTQHLKFQEVLDGIADKVKIGILSFYAMNEEDLTILAGDKDIELLTLKTINQNSDNTNAKLRVSIINCMRYINEAVIALLDIFQSYSHIIADLDFMIDESKFGTDNSLSLAVGFKRLTDTTKRISQHIPNINTLTISGMIAVYRDTVIKGNFDAVYSIYKFNNYSVIDNSEVHKQNSLVRLCDITLTGIFELLSYNEGPNRVYDYDEYAAFNDTTIAQIMVDKPVLFKVTSKYFSNSWPLAFQLSSVQITEMVDDLLTYNSALTQEAILQYKKYVSSKDALLFQPVSKIVTAVSTVVLDTPSRGDDDIPIAPADEPDAPGSRSTEVKPDDEYLVMQPLLSDRDNLSGNLTSGSGSGSDSGSNDNSPETPIIIKDFDGLLDRKNYDVASENTTTNSTGTYTTLSVPKYNDTYNNLLLNAVKNNESDSAGLILSDRWSATLIVGTKVPTDLSQIKFNQSSLLMSTIGAGIIPYVDNSIKASYITVNTDIPADMYEKYAACFTTPNKNVSKRSALFTFTQNESNLKETMMITQLGAPLILDIYIEYPIVVSYNEKFGWELYKYSFFGDWLNPVYNITGPSTSNMYGSTNFHPNFDMLFLTNSRSIKESVKSVQEQFLILPIPHEDTYASEDGSGSPIGKNIHCRLKIYYNSYSKSIPSVLQYIVIRLCADKQNIIDNDYNTVDKAIRHLGGIDFMAPELRKYIKKNSAGEYEFNTDIAPEDIEELDIMYHPRINISYTYDGQVLWSGITAGILTDDKCEIKESGVSKDLYYWLTRRQSDLPIMDIHAWNQNNVQLLCLYSMDLSTEPSMWDEYLTTQRRE